MPLRLLKFALAKEYPEPPMFGSAQELKPSYDLVIIGAGGHGLASAYYLAKDYGMKKIAVLEKNYIGSGNTGRNTTIIRSNYLTPEGVKFYDESVRLWQDLSTDFDLNLFYANRGHLTLAHSDSSLRTMRWRAEVNKHLGVKSELISAPEVKRLCPQIDIECGGHAPILGALYHEPGSIARHDAVAWGYGRGACQRGVEIHQQTEVIGITVKGDHITEVLTNRGKISTDKVLCATAGSTPQILKMVGLPSPIYVHPLQAMVSEPVKPWLDKIIVSGTLHVYISQSARGELVMGASPDPYELHQSRSTFDYMEGLSARMLDLFPFLSHVKVVRQWGGMADMTPDFAPIMGKTPIQGFYLDVGWGTWGFKATPVCGKTMSYTVAHDRNHPLIEKFGLERFSKFQLVGERGAAAVSH